MAAPPAFPFRSEAVGHPCRDAGLLLGVDLPRGLIVGVEKQPFHARSPLFGNFHHIRDTTTMALIRDCYADFGPILVAKKLAERHRLTVSHEALRKWMRDVGLWQPRKERRTFRQPRLRRECLCELIQIDGSDHLWFEDRGTACTLLVFVDDATSTLMHLEFVSSEGTFMNAIERPQSRMQRSAIWHAAPPPAVHT